MTSISSLQVGSFIVALKKRQPHLPDFLKQLEIEIDYYETLQHWAKIVLGKWPHKI